MKTQLLLFSCIILSFIGCAEIDKMTQFNMEYNETLVVPASNWVNLPISVLTPDVETNSESEFSINDTRKDLIEEINLTTLSLTITSPSNADFSFLKSINVYLVADGLDEIKVAWKDNIPSDVSILNLDVTGVDLKEYIKKDKFSLRLNVITDEALASDHSIDVHSVFFVDAKILGQ